MPRPYLLKHIAAEHDREQTLRNLRGKTFNATCTKSNSSGTCGYLSHEDFEGEIYIDVPVTKGIKIHTNQSWQFEVGAHRIDAKGQWIYRALKATLASQASSGKSGQPEQPAKPKQTSQQTKCVCGSSQNGHHTLEQIATPEARQKKEAELKGRRFEAVCVKSCGTFGFLGNVPFEGNLFIHRTATAGDPIQEGDKWLVEVGTLLDKKKNSWCYSVKTGHICNSNTPKPLLTGDVIAPGPAKPTNSKPHVSIYIDETWPGTQNPAYKDIGVIGGIAVPWKGICPNRLPVIKTHLDNGKEARDAINQMLAKQDVFPFVFPIKCDKTLGTSAKQYFELVQHALMLLLGWLLPRRDQPTTVNVYLEHFTGFMDGHDETEFIQSLTQAMRLFSGSRRFSHWTIQEVKWVGKEFAYVPYGDLVCKTCVPLQAQQLLAKDVKVRNWEGFLPFSREVFHLLHNMDTASPAGLADLLISFAQAANGTPLFRRIQAMAIERAKSDTSFSDAIFSRFEECYSKHEKDIALLNRVVPQFLEAFSIETFKDRPRSLLLRILIGFQHANHNGDPDLANTLVEQYRSFRPRMIKLDRDLCAYTDLNLAVHLHDSFDFESALSLAKEWIEDPLFPALSILNQGKMLSSCGQSLALLGRHDEAEATFVKSLSMYSAEPELFENDIEQTATYRAMNLLNSDARAAIPIIETLLGKSLRNAAGTIDHVFEKPFIAHLLLKALWLMRGELADEIQALIAHLPPKIPTRNQHPYELILFYLALLAKSTASDHSQEYASEIEDIFDKMEFGGTLGLIHAYIRVVLRNHGLAIATEMAFLSELNIVARYIPNARPIISKLRLGWAAEISPIEGILPFNYC